jgi:hypothetical protein
MSPRKRETFYGWRVVGAAFVLAVFGWGLGFYGPPVYLHAVREARGFSLPVASAAVTTHFLFGAIMVANLPALYRRFGVAAITKLAALSLAIGVAGWALAAEPWQLFAATLFSGAGWVAMSAAAVNAILSPWFVRKRPAALATAYNGASVGGVIFSPLWVAAISLSGFPLAATLIGMAMVVVVFALSHVYFSKSPDAMGLAPDGAEPGGPPASVTSAKARPLPGALLVRDFRFITLAAGMTLGLFAQVGLFAHLFSLLVPALGAQGAGLAMGGATVAAIAGRTSVGWLMPANADRRIVASASYAVQIAGSLVLIAAAGDNVPLLLLGVILFGSGIGNATSLPPLIAQVEFVKDDVARVVPLVVAISQGSFAFAPLAFGLIREFAPLFGAVSPGAAPALFIAAAFFQTLAIAAFLIGRR